MLDVLAVPDFVLHVLNLLLGWIETHASHHVGDGAQGNFAIELSCLCGMLVFGSYLTVVKEVFQITHDLSVGASF